MTAKETNVIIMLAEMIESFVDSAVEEKFALPKLLEGVLLLIAKGESRVITLLLRESPELGKQVKKDFQNLRQLLDAELHANLSDGFDNDDFVLELTFTRIVNNVRQLARRLRDAVADGTKQNIGKAKSQPEKLSAKARVLAVWTEHPEWSDTKIAKAAGISRTTLYNYPEFKNLRAQQKQNKNRIHRGSKDRKGNIEAFDK